MRSDGVKDGAVKAALGAQPWRPAGEADRIRAGEMVVPAGPQPEPAVTLQAVTLQEVFAAEVPITHHLGIRVDEADASGVTLTLPLGPNRNAHGTMFAGSVNAAATLAGWGVVWLELGRLRLRGMVVVQDSRIEYRAPIAEDCRVVAVRPDIRVLERFAVMLERRRRGRIDLTVMVQTGRVLAAHFHGRYVAIL